MNLQNLWFILAGYYLTLAIYHFTVFWGRREDKNNLYFSFLVLSFSFVLLAKIFDLHSQLLNRFADQALIFKLIANTLSIIAIYTFSYNSLKFTKFNILCKILFIIFIVLPFIISMVFVLAFKNTALGNLLFIIPSVLFGFIYWGLITTLFFAEKKYKVTFFRYIFIGLSLNYIFYMSYPILSVLHANIVIQLFAINTGLVIFSLMSSITLIKEFNYEHKQLVMLKNTLEQKVKERTNELQNANIKLKEENQKRIDFFINLSHETRTPLMLVQGYFKKYIKKTGITDDLKIISENLNIMSKNIINFLDAEKLSRNEFVGNSEIFCISNQLKQKALIFSDIAKKKNIKISHKIDNDVFCKLDIFAMDKVFNNLIENAIKYTPEKGKIIISINTDDDKIIVRIKDNGIGIKKEIVGHVFEPYYQIERVKFNYQGLGMGLYITKTILDKLNSKIEIVSEENQGTEVILRLDRYLVTDKDTVNNFAFTLPVEDNLVHVDLEERNIEPYKSNILIVDDQPATLKYLQDILSADYNVYLAQNGKEAICRLNKIKADLILSDIMMDLMDGYDFRKIIMVDEKLNKIPFLYLTALDNEMEKAECYNELHIDGYITKPFEENDLLYKANALIKNKQVYDKLNLKFLESKKDSETIFYKKCDEKEIDFKERKIIKSILDGHENKKIADIHAMSEGGVKSAIQRIYKKVGVNNRINFVKYFIE